MTEISPFVVIFSIKFSCASYPPPREMELSTFKIGRVPGGGIGAGSERANPY